MYGTVKYKINPWIKNNERSFLKSLDHQNKLSFLFIEASSHVYIYTHVDIWICVRLCSLCGYPAPHVFYLFVCVRTSNRFSFCLEHLKCSSFWKRQHSSQHKITWPCFSIRQNWKPDRQTTVKKWECVLKRPQVRTKLPIFCVELNFYSKELRGTSV